MTRLHDNLYLLRNEGQPLDINGSIASDNGIHGAIPTGITLPDVYYALGPFPIGNREIGSDIIESFTSVDSIWDQFVSEGYNSSMTFPSDLADGGRVKWKAFYPDQNNKVTLIYGPEDGVRWNITSDALGIAGYLYYSWVFARFFVDQSGKYLLNCVSCSFSLDGKSYAGDIYGLGYGWNVVYLTSGYHTIRIRKGVLYTGSFSLQFQTFSNPEYVIKSDTILPTTTGTHVYGEYLAITMLNTGNSVLEDFTVNIIEQNMIRREASFVDTPSIYPGQTTILQVKANLSGLSSFTLAINTRNGLIEPYRKEITLYNTASPIFYYTYLDVDNSVQYAAAIPPRKTCEQMPRARCPIIVALHGAGSRAEWLISYYGQFDYAWVVAPSGRRRFGYDWTGPQMQNMYSALNALQSVISEEQRVTMFPDTDRLVFTGHSMGGHGCYIASTMNPDYALASMCVAGWTTFHQYIPYYTRNDISFIDSILKGLLESAIYESNPDLHMDNLKGIPFMTRIGAVDDIVSPWHSRRMSRIYSQISGNANASLVEEVPGKGHWWDQAVNGPEVRNFLNNYIEIGSAIKPNLPKEFTIVCVNPHGFQGRGGIKPLQLTIPFRLSKIHVLRISDTEWELKTSNIRRFGIEKVFGIDMPVSIRIDYSDPILLNNNLLPDNHFCKEDATGKWRTCDNLTWKLSERHPGNYGPMGIIFERHVVIVIGTRGSPEETQKYYDFAITLSNQLYVIGRYSVPIIKDSNFALSVYSSDDSNLILLGGPHTNLISQSFAKYFPVRFQVNRNILTIGDYVFNAAKSLTPGPFGCIFLSPFPNTKIASSEIQLTRMALVITGTNAAGFDLASRMVPVSSGLQIPDYLIVTKDLLSKGAGGIVAAGYWNNFWNFDLHSGYVDELLAISAPKNIIVPPPSPANRPSYRNVISTLVTIGVLLGVLGCIFLSLFICQPSKKKQIVHTGQDQIVQQLSEQKPHLEQQYHTDSDLELDEIGEDDLESPAHD